MPAKAKAERPLSKSQFIRGLQCPKALWLFRNRKDLIPEVDPASQQIFDQGHQIGVLAHQRFPGGTAITADFLHQEEALRQTAAAASAGAKVVYEAAALSDGTLVRADILVRRGKAEWDLIEVKGSTDVAEVYLFDLAIQRHVLEGAGFRISRTFLMHVNNQYVRDGEIDPDCFFRVVDATAEVKQRIPTVVAELRRLKIIISLAAAPSIDIGPHCNAPYPCAFQDHCWSHIPDYSVYDLTRIRHEKVLELKKRGVLEIDKVPDDFPLSRAQQLQVACAKSGSVHIEPDPIRDFLGELAYPLYFLDFETLNLAIPPYDGLRPFQQMPFQASVHIRERLGGPVQHAEYLGNGQEDPRPSLAKFLAQTIGRQGTVIAYNAGFEGQCLKALAAEYHVQCKALLSISNRLWDLGDPFRKCHYVHPAFKGSWSIKVVLPALVPSMSYKKLRVRDGGEAQLAYLKLMNPSVSESERRQVSVDLKAYCGQDTLAMVRILDNLTTLVSPAEE